MRQKKNFSKNIPILLLLTAVFLSACASKNVVEQITDTVEAGDSYNPLHFVTTNDDYSVSLKKDNIKINKPGTYTVLYEIASPSLKYTESEIEITVEDTTPPEFTSDYAEAVVGKKFNAAKALSAKDIVDGDVSDKIKIVKGSVDTSKEGVCPITVSVADSRGNKAEKKINVHVVDVVKSENAKKAYTAAKNALLSKLTYPESLSVKSVFVSEKCDGYDFLVRMECSLKNSSGKEAENAFYIGVKGAKVPDSQFATDAQKKNESMWAQDGAVSVQPE